MSKGFLWVASAVLIATLLGPATVAAQTTAAISGTVSDETGAVIPNAEVSVTNVGTSQARTVETNAAGRYYVSSLVPGRYQVAAAAPGFEAIVHSGITLTVGSEAVINFSLRLGQLTEKVEVTGEAPLVQTTTSSVAELVDSQKIRALPLNGRSVDQLIFLQPGVNVATGAGNSPNQGRGTKFSVNGARLTSNAFMLDGTDINDSQNFTPGGAGGQIMGVDSILEFQVLTHNPSAQYGRSMGGIINAVTKSGTNEFHGNLFGFLRNSKLDAKNFFDNLDEDIPPFKRNQFGASAGGPIRRDRLFFFGNYEGLRERLGVSKVGFVPDADARRGIIPGRAPIRVDPAVVPYLNLFPLPNGPSTGPGIAELRFSQTQPTRVDYVTAKVDWNATEQDSFFARYTIDDSKKLRMDAADHVLGLFAEDEPHRNQYVTLQATRVISPTMLNLFRFGFNRSVALQTLANIVDVPQSLSFIPGQPFGRIRIRGGVSPLGAVINAPRFFHLNSFQPSDDLNIVSGAHTLKTGFILERFQWNTANYNRIGGDYDFDSLESFLQAQVTSVVVPFPGSEPNRGIRAILFGTYLQDDYRVNRRLTLNLGLRYEITTVPIEVNGKMSFLDDPLDSTLEKKQPFKGNHLNFAPRVGFASDLRGNGKTSLRGGFGIFYDQILMNQFLNLFDRQPPQWLSVTLGRGAPFPHPLQAALGTPEFSPSVTVFDDYQTPHMYQYNLTLQQEIATNLVASVGYVGSIGKHLIQRFDGNTPIPTRLPDGTLFTPANARRRNPVWGDLQTRRLSGFSNYNAFQVSVNRRFAGGLQLQGVYTYSRSIDTSSGLFSEEANNAATGAQNPDNLFAEKGLSNFDIRNNAVINLVYQLPFGKNLQGVARQILSGWDVGGIASFSNGVPFTVENSANRSQNQTSGANFADRPNLVSGASNNPTRGASAGCSGIRAGTPLGTPTLYFDPCAFSPQPLGTFGNLGRNTVIGPGIVNFDFSTSKRFRMGEERELQFRAEFFNLLNRPNFAAPGANTRRIFDSRGRLAGTAGRISQTTTTSRQIQFGLRYTF
ncbi:MAG: TonB-dependent receptor [Acidobacteria bacterium]|nr:TonB-dependent receptor [Acidobacteriota bacterium]